MAGLRAVSRVGLLEWNIERLSEALHLTVEETIDYFRDGRRVSFILERRIRREMIGGTLSPSEGAGFDLTDPKGGKWEVRSITRRGVYFCPSYMVGSGRRFDERGFVEKLEEIEGYVLGDVAEFPGIPVWTVGSSVVRQWHLSGLLGAGSRVSRSKALALLKS